MSFAAEKPESTIPINLESKLKPVDMMSLRKEEISDSSHRKELMSQLKVKCEENLHHLKGKIFDICKNNVEVKSHPLSNSISARMNPDQIKKMSDEDEIKQISIDAKDIVTCLNESLNLIGVRDVWESLSVTGKNIKVAVLDSGVDKGHFALNVVGEYNATNESSSNGDPLPGNHATHVAGIISSQDVIHKGVAPDSEILNVKVLTSDGGGRPNWVISGLEEAIMMGADIANLSLGWSTIHHGWECYDADCILCRASDTAVDLGLHMVVAAGNDDNDRERLNLTMEKFSSIGCPGNSRSVITVGAADKSKNLANFSSRGPGTGKLNDSSEFRITKPDLCGPGVDITSTTTSGDFGFMSGTSMACPHVAGIVALMLEKKHDTSPRKIKSILKHTAQHMEYGPNESGEGLSNPYSAILHL